eukprot:13236396-Alexandrium_andersonii.AAC.1
MHGGDTLPEGCHPTGRRGRGGRHRVDRQRGERARPCQLPDDKGAPGARPRRAGCAPPQLGLRFVVAVDPERSE